MKNIYDVLKRKEMEIIRLQKDVEALQVAVRIIEEAEEPVAAEAASQASPVMTSASSVVGPAPVAYDAKPAAPVRNFP